jgi:hypothetical protein
MRWMRCEHEGRPRLGLVEGDAVLLHEGDAFGAPRPTGERLALDGLRWLPPCEPGQIVGLWNNFRAAAAKNGWAEPAEPLYFLKSPAAASGHGALVPAAAPEVGRVVYEGELAVVIGRTAHRLAREQAAGAIFGSGRAPRACRASPTWGPGSTPTSIPPGRRCAPAWAGASARATHWRTCSSRRPSWCGGCRRTCCCARAT